MHNSRYASTEPAHEVAEIELTYAYFNDRGPLLVRKMGRTLSKNPDKILCIEMGAIVLISIDSNFPLLAIN